MWPYIYTECVFSFELDKISGWHNRICFYMPPCLRKLIISAHLVRETIGRQGVLKMKVPAESTDESRSSLSPWKKKCQKSTIFSMWWWLAYIWNWLYRWQRKMQCTKVHIPFCENMQLLQRWSFRRDCSQTAGLPHYKQGLLNTMQ